MLLLGTGLAPIAEASPLDAIYGLGLSKDAADAKDPRKWELHGESTLLYIYSNPLPSVIVIFCLFVCLFVCLFLLLDVLGKCLMEVRSYLKRGHWNEDGVFVLN